MSKTATTKNTPDCQDWTPVVFNKPKSTSTSTTTSTQNSSLSNVGLFKTDDEKKTKYISKETSEAVRTARCGKNMTQKELAQKCNMDVAIVAEVERGGCVYNPGIINKIQTALGVKIPR